MMTWNTVLSTDARKNFIEKYILKKYFLLQPDSEIKEKDITKNVTDKEIIEDKVLSYNMLSNTYLHLHDVSFLFKKSYPEKPSSDIEEQVKIYAVKEIISSLKDRAHRVEKYGSKWDEVTTYYTLLEGFMNYFHAHAGRSVDTAYLQRIAHLVLSFDLTKEAHYETVQRAAEYLQKNYTRLYEMLQPFNLKSQGFLVNTVNRYPDIKKEIVEFIDVYTRKGNIVDDNIKKAIIMGVLNNWYKKQLYELGKWLDTAPIKILSKDSNDNFLER